jgi:hypothetical protein
LWFFLWSFVLTPPPPPPPSSGRNRGKFVGAQGSGSGAQNDTEKLDAKARKDARDAGLEQEEEKKPKGKVNTKKSASERRSGKKKKGKKAGW